MLIREARIEDARGIARVGVDTWRSAYRDIIADDYLNNMSYERSEVRWRERLADRECFTLVAQDDCGEITAFANAGPERDGDPIYHGEIYGLYVMKGSQAAGVGRELVRAIAARLIEAGIHTMLVWVLAANPSRGFYERLGGQLLRAKSIEIGGQPLEEVAYGWNQLPMSESL